MKKTVIFLLTALILCGCKAIRTEKMSENTITFINGIKDADVWILPETEENLKTTLWGAATLSGIKKDESRNAPLGAAGENGLYIIRIIDNDNIFYSADGVTLKQGWTVMVTGDDLQSIMIEVSDEKGVLQNTYKAFAASL